MNRDVLKGQWRELRGRVKQTWGKLTDDDLTQIEGNFDRLIGVLQQRYGFARADAERSVNQFLERIGMKDKPEAAGSPTSRAPGN